MAQIQARTPEIGQIGQQWPKYRPRTPEIGKKNGPNPCQNHRNRQKMPVGTGGLKIQLIILSDSKFKNLFHGCADIALVVSTLQITQTKIFYYVKSYAA